MEKNIMDKKELTLDERRTIAKSRFFPDVINNGPSKEWVNIRVLGHHHSTYDKFDIPMWDDYEDNLEEKFLWLQVLHVVEDMLPTDNKATGSKTIKELFSRFKIEKR